MRGERLEARGASGFLAGAVEAGPPSKSESLGLEVMCCWGRFCLLRQLTLQMCVACLLTRFFPAPTAEASGICTAFGNKVGL